MRYKKSAYPPKYSELKGFMRIADSYCFSAACQRYTFSSAFACSNLACAAHTNAIAANIAPNPKTRIILYNIFIKTFSNPLIKPCCCFCHIQCLIFMDIAPFILDKILPGYYPSQFISLFFCLFYR